MIVIALMARCERFQGLPKPLSQAAIHTAKGVLDRSNRMNIASLDHSGIREARERLAERQHQLEETAVANLSHRPVHFGLH